MNKKKNNGIFYVVISLVTVLAVGSIAAIGYSGYGTPKVVVEGNYIEAGQPVGEVTVVDPELGAMPGPTISSPFLSVNGVTHWYGSGSNQLATSTICSIQSPNATSTLVFASIIGKIATATAQYLEIGVSSNPTATTTSLGKATVAASALYTLIASSTAYDSLVFRPNYYLVFKNGIGGTQAGNGYSAAKSASCKAEWIEN